ncbi:MAG: RCC1 repeat-containing protein [Actinomycetes bacterium]
MRRPSVRLIRAAALSAAALAIATSTTVLVALPSNAALPSPWDADGGLVFAGDNAEEPTAPGDVWSALHGRSVAVLGTTGAGRHTCVIDTNGEAVCIGSSYRGRLGIGTKYDTTSAAAVTADGVLRKKSLTGISTGTDHTCALAGNGRAYCWGVSSRGQVGSGTTRRAIYDPAAVDTSGVLSGKTLTEISAGGQHTCALATNGKAYCWGRGSAGQLGNGGSSDAARPVAVDTSGVLAGKTLVAIDAGTNHTCAVASTGAAYCWGAGSVGQLGSGATTKSTVAVKVSGTGVNLPIATVSAALAHTCALTTIGRPYCWGDGAQGRLGTGTTDDHATPVGVAGGNTSAVRSISASDTHTCLVNANRYVHCWGAGGDGQLGNGSRTNALTPLQVDATGFGSDLPETVAATPHGTCAMGLSGSLYCWGVDESSAAGISSTAPVTLASAPTSLDGKVIQQVTDDAIHTCALTGAGAAYCWGYGAQGQLGIGSRSTNYRPQPVVTTGALSGVRLTDITAGEYHTCGVSDVGKAYCWGNGNAGQIGDGGVRSRTAPRAVDASGVLKGKTLVDITAGDVFSCAIASAGKAYCWGGGGQGQLGNGAMTAQSAKPVRVDTSGVLSGKTLVAIDAGYAHVCALDTAGRVYCWGNNFYGELGNGLTKNRASPVAVDVSGALAGKTLADISAGDATTCAVSSAGRAYCWGDGGSGQIGDGTTSSRNVVPRAVDASGVLSGVALSNVSVGGRAACGLSGTGYVYCWGASFAGQLGYGGYRTKTRPVAMYTGGTLSRTRVTQVATGRATWLVTAQR